MIQVMNNLNLLHRNGVMDDQTGGKDKYSKNNSIKFETNTIKSIFCDYSDAYILVTGDIMVTGAVANADVIFKNCEPTRKTEINDIFHDDADHIYITMPLYNLIEYGDNYSDISGSLWQYKVPANNADLTAAGSESFK